MKLSTFTLAGLLAMGTHAAPAPAEELAQRNGLTFLNLTSLDELPAIAKRQNYEYFLFFFADGDCSGSLVGGWGGSGTSGCNVVPEPRGRSLNWLPYNSGRTIRVSTSENCLGRSQSYGPNESGCKNFQAHITQSRVSGFRID